MSVVEVRESSFNVIQMDGLYVVVHEGTAYESFPGYAVPGGGKLLGETLVAQDGNVHESLSLYGVSESSKRPEEKALVQEDTECESYPIYGVPGGGKLLGETYREAAAREALEETGLEVKVDEELGWYYQKMSRNGHQLLRRVFRSHVIGGDLTVSARHPDIQLISYRTAKDWHRAGLLRTNIDIVSITDHHRGARRPSTRQQPITVPSQHYVRRPRALAS